MPERERGRMLLERVRARSGGDDVIALARAVCLAVLVEPGLLRRARLRLTRGLDVAVESDLHFSPLVSTRNRTAVVLDPDVLAELRGELTGDQTYAARARQLVADEHAEHPAAIRLEEDVVWETVCHGAEGPPPETIESHLRPAVKAMAEDADGGRRVARWVVQAARRLPAEAVGTEACRLLTIGAGLRLGEATAAASEPMPDALAWLAPGSGPSVTLGIELTDDGLRFTADDRPVSLPVPATSPRLVEVAWNAADGSHAEVVTAAPGAGVALRGAAGITLRTLDGRRYSLERDVAEEDGPEAQPHWYAPAVVSVLGASEEAVGYLVSDREAVTARLDAAPYRVRHLHETVAATPVARGQRVLVLRLDRALEGTAPVRLARAPAVVTGTSASVAAGRGMFSGTVAQRRFHPYDTGAAPLAGSPVVAREEVIGHVDVRRPSGAIEVVPVEEVLAVLDSLRAPAEESPQPDETIGRERELEAMLAALDARQIVVLAGPGGVGKTYLARKYAHDHQSEYVQTWWVDADSDVRLAHGLTSLADALAIPVADMRDVGVAVAAALAARRGWLLVLDNVADPAAVEALLAPRQGHVIVTTRLAGWPDPRATVVRVGPLPAKAAVRLLVEGSGDSDPQAAEELAERLGGLPLALELAAAYVRERRATLRTYLELLSSHRSAGLARPGGAEGESLTVTFELALETVDPEAAEVLTVASHLAPEPIPRALLAVDPEQLADLARFSLVEATNGAFTVHRLVAAFMRDRLSPEEQSRRAAQTQELVLAAFPAEVFDPVTWPLCETLLPHALPVAQRALGLGVEDPRTVRLLTLAGDYLVARADFTAAREPLEEAVAVAERLDSDPVAALTAVAACRRGLGDLRGALATAERAADAARVRGLPGLYYARLVIGALYRDLGELGRAREVLEEVLNADASPGQVANAARELGALLADVGERDAARQALERALNAEAHGSEALEAVLRAERLALGSAKGSFDELLKVITHWYGPDHPEVARALALRAVAERRPEDGERALAIMEAAYPPAHPELARLRARLDRPR